MALTAVREVTAENRADFERLFAAKGAPHYCWCTPYRLVGNEHLTSEERRDAMLALVDRGVPVGVLGYEGDAPVGWCSIAPRETYAKLARSRTMPRETPEDVPTWTVLCFYVPRPRRGEGLTLALLDGAVRIARERGAAVVEGYPFDTAGISSTHRGHSSVFGAAGFVQDGRRWAIEL